MALHKASQLLLDSCLFLNEELILLRFIGVKCQKTFNGAIYLWYNLLGMKTFWTGGKNVKLFSYLLPSSAISFLSFWFSTSLSSSQESSPFFFSYSELFFLPYLWTFAPSRITLTLGKLTSVVFGQHQSHLLMFPPPLSASSCIPFHVSLPTHMTMSFGPSLSPPHPSYYLPYSDSENVLNIQAWAQLCLAQISFASSIMSWKLVWSGSRIILYRICLRQFPVPSVNGDQRKIIAGSMTMIVQTMWVPTSMTHTECLSWLLVYTRVSCLEITA